MNAGVKRLAILLGCFGLLLWCTLVVVLTHWFYDFGHPPVGAWVIIILQATVSFLIPFGLVYGIAWVVRGFRLVSRERERKPRAEESEDDE